MAAVWTIHVLLCNRPVGFVRVGMAARPRASARSPPRGFNGTSKGVFVPPVFKSTFFELSLGFRNKSTRAHTAAHTELSYLETRTHTHTRLARELAIYLGHSIRSQHDSPAARNPSAAYTLIGGTRESRGESRGGCNDAYLFFWISCYFHNKSTRTHAKVKGSESNHRRVY